jgi:hypothetical protein
MNEDALMLNHAELLSRGSRLLAEKKTARRKRRAAPLNDSA